MAMMSWCTRHWFLSLAGGLILAFWTGLIPSPGELLPRLADQPDVATAFRDPAFGKQDAMLFLFSFLFLGPFAGFVSFFVALIVLGILGAIFLPLGTKIGLPEWFSTGAYLSLLGVFIYAGRDAWMPTSLWFLGLVARSWMVVMG